MQVVLIMSRNGGERRSFSVARSTTVIGRREDCDLRIPVGEVSRKHCRLVLGTDNLSIQDLGSSHGTFVNGERVQDAFLNAGDSVVVGPVTFIVQIDGVPDEHDLPAPAGDTAAGGTALAVAALDVAEPDVVDAGDLAEVDDLLEPLPESSDVLAADASTEDVAYQDRPAEADAEPAASADLTLDELPPGSAQDAAAFDLVEIDEPPAAAPAAAAPGEWDFLIEDAPGERSQADLHIDLDASHGQ